MPYADINRKGDALLLGNSATLVQNPDAVEVQDEDLVHRGVEVDEDLLLFCNGAWSSVSRTPDHQTASLRSAVQCRSARPGGRSSRDRESTVGHRRVAVKQPYEMA